MSTNFSKTLGKTKIEIEKYLKSKLTNLSHAQRRCVIEVFYGILHSGNVTLTGIARSLNESNLLKKTVERLSRNLLSNDFSSKLEDSHLKDVAHTINNESIIVFDDSDLLKNRAKKLENLCPIRDGSTGNTGVGYNLQYSCVVSDDRKEVKSLMTRVYSTEEKNHYSQRDEREKHMHKLFKAFNNEGVYVMDRGFSNIDTIRLFDGKRKLVVRAKNRNILFENKKVNLYSWAREVELKYATQITSINKEGKKILKDTYFSIKNIEIEGICLTAVVMELDGHKPCVLLTNQKRNGKDDYNFGKMIINQYGYRWSVEEKIRFEKQQFKYENIRLQHFVATKNMLSIINLISGFISHIYWKEISGKLIKIAQVIKEEVRLEYYRITEGIKRVFQMRSSPVFRFGRNSRRYFPRNYQTEFWEL